MVDNAIISVWPGKRAGRRVLVLSGGHTWGTQAAAEYVTEGDYLRELESHLLACRRRQGLPRHPDFFQVLLRVEIRDNQPVGVRYVAHRDLAITETGEPTLPPTRRADDITEPALASLVSGWLVTVSRSSYSDRSACRTSTRDARMAGMSDATIAAPMSTIAAPITGSAPGNCTVPNSPSATRTSA